MPVGGSPATHQTSSAPERATTRNSRALGVRVEVPLANL